MFMAYSLPSTLHQVEILRSYREDLGMSTYLWKVKLLPGDSEFLPTLRCRANDPALPLHRRTPLPWSKLQCMSIPTKVSTQCGCQRNESPRYSLLCVLHHVLVCCHANINKDITCCGTTSHSRATAASAVEKSWQGQLRVSHIWCIWPSLDIQWYIHALDDCKAI